MMILKVSEASEARQVAGAMAAEKRQTCGPKLHIETEYESQLTTIL